MAVDYAGLNGDVVLATFNALRRGTGGIKGAKNGLKKLMKPIEVNGEIVQPWRFYRLIDESGVAFWDSRNNPPTSFREFIEAPPFRGLGEKLEDVERLLADDPAALVMLRELTTPAHGGDRISDAHKPAAKKAVQGNSRAYTLTRLKKERPDLFESVAAGELSANAAAIEAGWRKPVRKQQQQPPLAAAKAAWHCMSDEERAAFREYIGTPAPRLRAAVTVNTGPVTAERRARDIPKEKWNLLIDAREAFIKIHIPADCRRLFDFIEEARDERMWEHTSRLDFKTGEWTPYADLNDLIQNGLGIDPDLANWAIEGLRALRPEELERAKPLLEAFKRRAPAPCDYEQLTLKERSDIATASGKAKRALPSLPHEIDRVLSNYRRDKSDLYLMTYADTLVAAMNSVLTKDWAVFYEALAYVKKNEKWRWVPIYADQPTGEKFKSFEQYFESRASRPFSEFITLEKTYRFAEQFAPELLADLR